MRLIGWANWHDPNYAESVENKELAIELTIEYMKEMGLKFTGTYHQEGQYGAPVFDNDEKLCLSQRGWGELMVYVMDLDVFDFFTYLVWAWFTPHGEEQIFPDESVCIFNEFPPVPDFFTKFAA